MRTSLFSKLLKSRGFKIITNAIRFNVKDSAWYYPYNDSDVLVIHKKIDGKEYCIATSVYGDIRIYSKRNRDKTHFVFKGGHPDGQLTTYLMEFGDWENNNWFETNIYRDGKAVSPEGTICYTTDQVANDIFEKINEIESGVWD